MAGDDVDIRVRATSAQAQRAFRDLKDQVAGLKGALIPLASAAVPVAASMTAVTAKAGGATLAVAAFGAAVAGQVSHLSAAADAQTKYSDAVVKSGRGSKEAAEAQRAIQATLAAMPVSTARAAVGLQTLKSGFQDWSDSIADFTMTPVEKSFTLLNELVPKLTPMARGASEQLDRLVTVAGGAVGSPGFDAFSDRVSTFANSALKDAVDGIIGFSRALSEGRADGPVKAFMDYAAQNGPAVRETMSTLGDAVATLAEAAADAGPGMLTLVNAAAGLVAALPPGLVTVLMQTAVALKAVSLAGAGAAAIASGVAALGARITALGAASAAAGGGLAGFNAALNTLGTGGKAMLAAGAVGALVLVMHQLSDNKAPVAVDELSTSLNTLATTGQVTGALKGNFDEMSASIAMVSKGASDNKFLQLTSDMGTWLGIATGPSISDAVKNVDAWDKTMANNVRSGNVTEAAAQYEILRKAWLAGDGDLKELDEATNDYKNALADQAFEQEHAVQSMGVFGQAALDTSAKLEAQKESADGLRASILALNDVNRSAHDAQTQFGEALDGLTASFKEHGATLSADTEAGRANRDAMSAASAAQDELLASGIAAGDSLGSMTKKSEELRAEMMRLAVDAFDGNKKKAREYVDELLGTPSDIKTLVKLEREEAITGLKDVQAEIEKTPGAKKVTVDTLNGAAIAALEKVGLKTKQLPDGKTQVFTANGQALGPIGSVRQALDSLNGKTANTYVKTTYTRQYNYAGVGAGTARSGLAAGGRVKGYADGGELQHFPNGGYIQGPGGPRSDSILATMGSGAMAQVSDTEYVVQSAAVKKYGVQFLDALNQGRLKVAALARGGVTKKEREARKQARGELTISHFGKMAGFQDPEFRNQLSSDANDTVMDMVKHLNKWRSVIKKTTHGFEESRLTRWLDLTGRALIRQQGILVKTNKSLEKAKDKLDGLKDAAGQLKSGVKSGIISGANLTRAATAEDSQVTINTLLSQARGDAAQAGEFERALATLKKRGASGRVIEQIAGAGVTGGGLETARALLGADKGQIKELNVLNQSIRQSADDAGDVAADAMYGAGIKAAQGLVKGLDSYRKVIEAGMERIAKSMERGIKKSLKIKSPSQVMETIGEQTAEGFAQGIQRNRNVQPAWASMLNMPRAGSRASAPAGGTASSGWGDRPVAVTLQIGNTELGEVIIDPVRKAISTRGGLKRVFPRDF
jgi:hypothetical protein